MRRRNALLLGAAFAIGLLVQPGLGLVHRAGFPGWPIGPARADDAEADRAESFHLFDDVLARVREDYVVPVSTHALIDHALDGMLSGLDPHSSYLDPKAYTDMQSQTRGAFGGLGMDVTEDKGLVKVISPIDGTPAARAGIKPGDLILAVDGKTVEGLSINEAVDHMRGQPGTKVELTIARAGVDKPLLVALTREIIHIQVVKQRLFGDIGYIRLSSFDEQADEAVRTAIGALRREAAAKAGGHLQGYVLDLRNNPGGLLDQAVAVASDFLDGGRIVSTRGRHDDDDQSWDATVGGDLTQRLPLVVLINDGSASASEIVAGALQDAHRAYLLGERSFGKGSVQTIIPLPNHGALRLTTARYYTPSGRSIQGDGITPDIAVAETRETLPSTGFEHEAELNHVLSNSGGAAPPPMRADLPPAALALAHMPPVGWPAFDAANPATDFQLQQALALLRGGPGQHSASAK